MRIELCVAPCLSSASVQLLRSHTSGQAILTNTETHERHNSERLLDFEFINST
jgi:hypothetical protein